MYLRGDGEALLATVRGIEPPRIHPINVGIVADRLYAFIIASSAKRMDLATDGRYALHSHVDPAAPSEFMVRGRASSIEGEVRPRVAADWYFDIDEAYELFEFSIEHAVLGVRGAEEWPLRYTSWRAAAG